MKRTDIGTQTSEGDSFTLTDLGNSVAALLQYLRSKIVAILVIGVVGAVIGFAYSLLRKPQYTATSTFVLEESGKGGGAFSQYANLASMAGIDLSAGGNSIFSGDNIIELYRSRLMISNALLSTATFDNKQQLLIDRYIDFNKLRKKWSEDDDIGNVSFVGDRNKFSRLQDSILTDIVIEFNTKFLKIFKPDKKLNIICVQFTTGDELFAKEFTERLVQTANDFYVSTKTKKSTRSVSVLQQQADSIKRNLNSSITSVASAVDATPNANPLKQASLRAPSQRKTVDVQANTVMYSEIVKNLEVAKINLLQETPLIQIIDKPVLPLYVNKLGKIKGALVGFVLGVLMAVIFWALKKILKIA